LKHEDKIVDFDKLYLKNVLKKHVPYGKFKVEIFVMVVKYVYANIEESMENPLEDIRLDSSLAELFSGNVVNFVQTIFQLINYWEIDLDINNDLPKGTAFEI
jgi:hypothetical protein